MQKTTMTYNVYKVKLGLDEYEICEEDEQRARIACAHANSKPIREIISCQKIGETNKPFIRKICKR